MEPKTNLWEMLPFFRHEKLGAGSWFSTTCNQNGNPLSGILDNAAYKIVNVLSIVFLFCWESHSGGFIRMSVGHKSASTKKQDVCQCEVTCFCAS